LSELGEHALTEARRRLGFEECAAFGDYPDSGASTFMTRLSAGS